MSELADDQTAFDRDTGEIPTLSQRMVTASVEAREHAQREAILLYNKSLNAALLAVARALNPWVTAETENKAFKNKEGNALKYASLKNILETVRPVLLEHGILLRQGQDKSWSLDEGGGSRGRLIPVYTDLVHVETGKHDRTIIEIPLMVSTPQAMGSAITYGRRYSLLAALGLTTDEADDDGNAAKLRDLTETVTETLELAKLKKEIDDAKDATSLLDWGAKLKATKRAERLSEGEHAILRQYFASRSRALLNGDETPAEKPKKGKAE